MMTVELLLNILSWALILLGSGLVLIGSFGFFRLPDFWSRLHAASVIDSGGMILIILGMCFQAGLSLITVKLLFIAIFLIITGPTATHAVANAALVSGLMINDRSSNNKIREEDLKIEKKE
ncbi:MAG: sodium:proton antiporter [Rhodobacteraceae bacterium]|nr:MAG: sodium:proton antiporter [Paracoccaceae bacterium]|tara:strand:- start:45 stop:407 length:363 start_codon:yes stop_codon:yes gene_type:complete